ncbi:MAG TPA: HAMP domain-containing histidine kinase [Chloroflexi bacterium]|nr:HAMP domain-containing histidine kinase [Chloroflexota bacterium]
MFKSLRARLLTSYIVLISLTLCTAAFALALLLRSNPLAIRRTYQNLDTVARASLPYLNASPDRLDERLAEVAEVNHIRILRLGPDQTVLFDSKGEFAPGQTIELEPSHLESLGPGGQRGVYRDASGRQWFYLIVTPEHPSPELGRIVFAASLQRTPALTVLGESLLKPLIQAGVIGLCVSVILAAVIANSVARPLRRTVEATNAIASGDYSHQVPEKGPREVKELARAFNNMVKQVQRTQQTQRDFLANVSHELKTPLTSIQGYSQAILDGAATDPTRAARVIYDEAGRLHRLVKDLLDLARIESGQAPLRRDYIDLQSLLETILEQFAIQAAEKNVRLTREVEPLPRLTGDSDRLAQVFTNLVDNALTHTPPGGQVAVRAHRAEQGVEVVISDTGRGIPAEDLDRIFERFYQVDKSRARSGQRGTGLGLTICKEIVEAHGGSIRAESEEGHGAKFYVWLPLPRPSDETIARPSRSRK